VRQSFADGGLQAGEDVAGGVQRPELLVAHDVDVQGSPGDDRRGCRNAVVHADLTKEVSVPDPGGLLEALGLRQ
jgi:hypothetical protein